MLLRDPGQVSKRGGKKIRNPSRAAAPARWGVDRQPLLACVRQCQTGKIV